jgi:DHA2 family multidrug resistance protein
MITWAVTQELPAPSAAALLRFLAMCVGMFMGVLDIQIVATSLQAIDTALAIPPERMS